MGLRQTLTKAKERNEGLERNCARHNFIDGCWDLNWIKREVRAGGAEGGVVKIVPGSEDDAMNGGLERWERT